MTDDPETSRHTPPSPGARGASLQRDSADTPHSVKTLAAWREVSVSGRREDRIAAVAGSQRGRIAYRQLQAIGLSPSSIAWLVARGRLFPTLRCVFVVGHTARVELGAETEALLSVREGAVLSHWSAAALWGLWTPAPAEVDVMVAGASTPATNPGVHVHRSRILESRDVRICRALPLTSPARTLLDIAPTASERQLELAFDRALREKLMRPTQVADVVERAGGHRGRRPLADLLAHETGATTMTRSEAEERMLGLMRAAGLPQPLVNADVAGYEVDFYWPAHRFAVEVDGWAFHSGRRAFEDDRRKDQNLRRAGVDPMRTTGRQLIERPYALVASVADGLARAATRNGGEGGGAGAGAPGPGR